MTRGEILERFFETYSFSPGNRTVPVFDFQVCLYKKRRNGIFLCPALLRDSLWDSSDVFLFREHTYADACLARITDKRHSYRLEMNGISMREAEK